jgi:hypothetical protein
MKFNFIITLLILLYSAITFAEVKTKFLLINKSNRNLIVFLNNGEVKNFTISLGFEPFGKKVKRRWQNS